MGFGGGGSSPTDAAYVMMYSNQYQAWLNGTLNPGAVGGWNAADLIVEATSAVGGSPYEFVESFDPTDLIEALRLRVETLRDAVDALDPISTTGDVHDAAELAEDLFDDHAGSSSHIGAVVTAAETRGKAAMLRQLSRTVIGLWDMRALMSTQVGPEIALIQAEFGGQLADLDARLRQQADMQRMQSVQHIMGLILAEKERKISALQRQILAEADLAKFEISAKTDQITQDLAWEINDTLWDLNLGPYASNFISATMGASQIPRPMTKGERILGTVTNALSAGLTAGADDPAMGIAAAALSLGGGLLTQLE